MKSTSCSNDIEHSGFLELVNQLSKEISTSDRYCALSVENMQAPILEKLGGRDDSMEKIENNILLVENQIEACADPDERKMLRKEKEQLREEKLILLRSNVGNVYSRTVV